MIFQPGYMGSLGLFWSWTLFNMVSPWVRDSSFYFCATFGWRITWNNLGYLKLCKDQIESLGVGNRNNSFYKTWVMRLILSSIIIKD